MNKTGIFIVGILLAALVVFFAFQNTPAQAANDSYEIRKLKDKVEDLEDELKKLRERRVEKLEEKVKRLQERQVEKLAKEFKEFRKDDEDRRKDFIKEWKKHLEGYKEFREKFKEHRHRLEWRTRAGSWDDDRYNEFQIGKVELRVGEVRKK